MAESGAAREVVLARIRAANRAAAAVAPPLPPAPTGERADLSQAELADLFAARVADYRAGVHRAAAAEIRDRVEAICAERGIADLVVPADLDSSWHPAAVTVRPDAPAIPTAELDRVGGVLTACRLAIAATGTIVFDGGPGQGRRALTLVPDLHICVVAAESIVYDLDQAIAAVADAASEGRPITFTSGPSATSDIELTRVEGVHGPRTLEVIIAS